MDTVNITIGNTVEISVEVEELSDSPTEAKIEIYKTYSYATGLTDNVLTVQPSSISNGVISFLFDTDTLMSSPGTLYGRFFVLDSGRKINAYFKLKFKY